MHSTFLRTAARTSCTLAGAAVAANASTNAFCGAALSPKEFREFKVLENEQQSADTHRIRVGFPNKEDTLGMPVASCLSIAAEIDGATVARPYTPISTRDQTAYAEFVVKKYPPRTDGKPGGLAAHLCSLKPEVDSIKMKGPWKKIAYEPNKWEHIGMIAGGSGITPMFQVLLEILNNPEDKTKVTMIFANKTEEDILLRKQLDEMSAKDSRFKVVYTLDNPGLFWRFGGGEQGFVNADMVRKSGMPATSSPGSMVFVCGPPPMMNSVCGPKDKRNQGEVGGVLKQMGFTSESVFKF